MNQLKWHQRPLRAKTSRTQSGHKQLTTVTNLKLHIDQQQPITAPKRNDKEKPVEQ